MVNTGIVGCGYWGPKLIRSFHNLAEANLLTVCDLEESKLEQIRTQYPDVKTTSDLGDLLRDSVEAVVIATPVNSHYSIAKEALLHDKHVLVEKPLTDSSRQAEELIELAQNRNRVLMVGHTYEYHPAVVFLRQLVKSGELGEVFDIRANRLNLGLYRPDINVLWDLAPHDISIVLSLLDREPIAVRAWGASHIYPEVCDVGHMELVFPNDVIAHIQASWLDPCKVRQITIVGSKKMVVYDDVSETEKIRIYDKGLVVPINDIKLTSWPPSYRDGDVTIPFISNAEPLKLECEHFLHCITEGKRPRSDGWAGLRVVKILETANRSLLDGGRREELFPITPIAEAGTTTIR